MSKIEWTTEQLGVINSIDKNTLVSASAGSGKTAVMLERLIRLVVGDKEKGIKGIPLRRIVTVTFNESVATELKGKINKQLVKLINKGVCDNDYIREQIEDLPLADISTLHSFCNSIIKSNFEYLDIDPSFSIVDDEERQVLFGKAITNIMKEYKADYDSEIDVLIGYFNGEQEFYRTLTRIYGFLESQLDREKYLKETFMSYYGSDFEGSELAKEYNKIMHMTCTELLIEAYDKYNEYVNLAMQKRADHIATSIKCLELIDKTKDFCQLVQALIKIRDVYREGYPSVPRSKQDDVDKAYGEEYKAFNAKYLEFVKDLIAKFGYDYEQLQVNISKNAVYVQKIAKLVSMIADEYAKLKKKDNKMDFADLEYYAVKLMQNDDIANELRQKYSYICVDEYQDINAVQEYIITRLSNGKNLFMVGDVKQSIYQFRMTDPQIFLSKFRSYEQDSQLGSPHRLNANYRSSGEVVNFVNDIFDVLMTRQNGGIDYRKESRLVQGNTKYDPQYDKPIKIVTFSKDENQLDIPLGEDKIYSVKDSVTLEKCDVYAEGLYIAKQIADMVGKQKIQVPMQDDQMGYREIKFSDIALLCSKRSAEVEKIVEVIKSVGIPIDAGNIVKEKSNPSIDLMVDLLRIIDNHRQDIPLVAVLTSNIFGGLSYSDMATIKKAFKDEVYFHQAIINYSKQKDDYIASKLIAFFDMLDNYRFASGFLSVSQLIRRIMIDYDMATYLHTIEDGAVQLVGLEQFVGQLESKNYNSSIVKFIDAVDNIQDFGKVAGDSAIQGDYVRTSTIHASKGLEYPIVFIIDAGRQINMSDANRNPFMCDKKYGVAIKNLNIQDRSYEDSLPMLMLKEIKSKELIEEYMRLFYVAVTRARNRLYVTATVSRSSGKEKAPKKFGEKYYNASSMWNWLNNIAYADSDFLDKYAESVEVETLQQNQDKTILPVHKVLDISQVEDFENYLAKEYDFAKATKTPVKFTVTALNNFAYEKSDGNLSKTAVEQVKDFKESLVDMLKEDNDDSQDINLYADEGIAYHKVMECIDFDCCTVKDVELQLDSMVEEGILTAEQRSFVDAQNILDCLSNPIIAQAIKYPHYREKQFMLNLPANAILDEQGVKDNVLLQGTIDLFIQGGDKGGENILVDFKFSKKTPEQVKKRYQKQLDLYAMAIEECLDIKVDKKIIFMLGKNIAIEM